MGIAKWPRGDGGGTQETQEFPSSLERDEGDSVGAGAGAGVALWGADRFEIDRVEAGCWFPVVGVSGSVV